MIDAFLFDLGNVLFHFSHERMCGQIAELCGLPAENIRRLLFEGGLQREFERGRLSEQAIHRRLEEVSGHRIDFDALVHAASDIFELNRPIEPLIESLRAQGRRLVVLSNTSVSHFRFVQRNFELLSRFDQYVLSYEVGEMKPDDAIFDAAIAAAGCPPERCFYTDDILEYVSAGRRRGLQAEVFTGVDSLIGQLRDRGVRLDL